MPTSTSLLAPLLVALAVDATASGPPPDTPPAAKAPAESPPAAKPVAPETPAKPAEPPASDTASARAEALERLKAAPPPAAEPATAKTAASAEGSGKGAETKPSEPSPPPDSSAPVLGKEMRQVLEERIRWLDEWDKLEKDKARREADGGRDAGAREASELKAEAERLKALLDKTTKDATVLLPEIFRKPDEPGVPGEAVLSEMKDALTTAQNEFKERSATLEAEKDDPGSGGEKRLTALRAERDKVRQRCTALKTRMSDREAALASATTTEARDLARERLVNLDWEGRVESERLKAIEAQLAIETAKAANAELRLQVLEARRELAKRTLAPMQARYQTQLDRRQAQISRDARSQQAQASRALDPLEKLRASWAAQLLEIQGQVLKDEGALADGQPNAALQEQTALAERAVEDFEQLKQLVEGGRAHALVALRLNNEFRRLRSERAAIVRNELTRAARQAAYYENVLTGVELDSLGDDEVRRQQLDAVVELVDPARRAEGFALAEEHERKRRDLMDRRRRVLVKLAARATATHAQVLRRLQVLDEQYNYVRTQIVWIRDAEPIGPSTLSQARREAHYLTVALAAIAQDPSRRKFFGPVEADFVGSLFGLAVLPVLLYAVRRACDRRLDTLTKATS